MVRSRERTVVLCVPGSSIWHRHPCDPPPTCNSKININHCVHTARSYGGWELWTFWDLSLWPFALVDHFLEFLRSEPSCIKTSNVLPSPDFISFFLLDFLGWGFLLLFHIFWLNDLLFLLLKSDINNLIYTVFCNNYDRALIIKVVHVLQ